MKKVRARVRGRNLHYIHNTLGNASHYFRDRVTRRIAADDLDGVGHEVLAGLILLAFEVEAQFNFLGHKLCDDWDERRALHKKVGKVCDQLGVKPDFDAAPYKTIEALRGLRNDFAHGKPHEIKVDEEVIQTPREIDKLEFLEPEWQKLATIDFLNEAYEAADAIWNDLLAHSGLQVIDTLGTREWHISVIGPVENGETP